jgi:beta-lactam-binding protein with PASTA domain
VAASGGAASVTAGVVEVPNVVGARLEAASRDLAAAGLRVGATTGPRDGHVVKQTPDAGARVTARSAVTLTLSGSAATTIELAPK